THGVADIDAETDAMIERRNLLVDALRRGEAAVAGAVVVDSHGNVVLLHMPLDRRQQSWLWADDQYPQAGRLAVVEGLRDLALLRHVDYAAAVEREARIGHLGGDGGQFLGLGVQRQVERLQGNMLEPGPLGQ